MSNMPKQMACDPTLLARLLDHQLDAEQVSEVELHLNECSSCQLEMEQLAASPEFWQGVQQRLQPEQPHNPLSSPNGRFAGDSAATRFARTHLTDEDERLDNHEAVESYMKRWLAPTDDPQALGRLGGYEVVGIVGIGGMSVVLKGFDRSLNRYVAIKVLGTHLASSGAARQRFSREAQAAAAIVHENVLAIHTIDEFNGLPYLVMPYVRGESLEKRLRRVGPFQLVEVLRIGQQIAAGLSAAHAQGLVHRDIKPANILLDEGSERLKISDFGLARAAADASLTHSGSIAGTPLYMSPEQARGEPVDPRSDLFSFGSLLYSLCTGHPPFRAETPYGIIRRICDDQARPIRESSPNIPDWMDGIIQGMMDKQVANRFASATELNELFHVALSHIQQPVIDQPLPEELQKFATPPAPLPTVNTQSVVKQISLVALVAIAGMLVLMAAISQLWVLGDKGDQPIANAETGSAASMNSNAEPTIVDNKIKNPQPSFELPTNSQYRFVKGDKKFYEVLLEVEQSDYVFKLDGLLELDVKAVVDDGGEIGYQLSYLRNVNPADADSDPDLMSLALVREGAALEDLETKGRIKVLADGGIDGRSAVARMPGEVGPLLDWIFPVVNSSNETIKNRNGVILSELIVPVYRKPVPGLESPITISEPMSNAMSSTLRNKFPGSMVPGMSRRHRVPRLSIPISSPMVDPLNLHGGSLGLFGGRFGGGLGNVFEDAVSSSRSQMNDIRYGSIGPVEYPEFDREIRFTMQAKDDETRMLNVSFTGKDQYEDSTYSLSDRSLSGSYKFDRATGWLQSLSWNRRTSNINFPSDFYDPVTQLKIRQINAAEAKAFKEKLRDRIPQPNQK